MWYDFHMKKWIKENKYLFIRLIVIAVLLSGFFTLLILKNDVEICESYSRGFGRFINTVIAAITKYFPISFTECFVIAVVIFTVIWVIQIIKFLRKKNFKFAISRFVDLVLVFVSIISMVTATMQLQYNRKSVPIPLYTEKVEKSEFMNVINHFLEDYNDCASKLKFKENGEVISPYSIMELNTILAKDFKILNGPEFDGYYSEFNTFCKPMMSSEIYSHLQITGVTAGAFGEANINTAAPNAGIPFVMAHELAHTKGAMREDEANLTALYVTLNSEDYFVRFSGYFYSFSRLMDLADYLDDDDAYAKVYFSLDENIRNTYKHNNKYWENHSVINDIGEWFNNLYIKTSTNGSQGTGSYDDTPTEVEDEVIISFSTYQKLYFQIYYK